MLQGIAMRRAELREIDRIPCHLFIDEVQNFTTPSIRTIMNEARKFRLSLTCCQQVLGDGMTTEIRNSILGSSNIQIVGATKPIFYAQAASLFREVSTDDIASLNVGQFYIKVGRTNPAFRFAVDSTLLKDANAMTPGQWQRVRRAQLDKYYRPLEAPRRIGCSLPSRPSPDAKSSTTTTQPHAQAVKKTTAVPRSGSATIERTRKIYCSTMLPQDAPIRTFQPILTD